MRARPRHVIFDLDGTLADSSSGILWSFRATLEAIGREADEEQLRRLIGPPLGDSFRSLGVDEPEIDRVVEIYRAFYAERGVLDAALYEGIASTLSALVDEGVRVAVATAKRVDFAHQMLENLGVAQHFDLIAGASLDLRITEKYEIMSEVVAHWDSPDPTGVWMVGDRHYDMVAARAHGVAAVGVRWGFGDDEELTGAGADWLISAPMELLDESAQGGSLACLLDEVCEVCGAVMDASHPSNCASVTAS